LKIGACGTIINGDFMGLIRFWAKNGGKNEQKLALFCIFLHFFDRNEQVLSSFLATKKHKSHKGNHRLRRLTRKVFGHEKTQEVCLWDFGGEMDSEIAVAVLDSASLIFFK
jgi:hypothetical protein